jgi:acetylornithine deacetylase
MPAPTIDREYLVGTLADLIRINSINPSLVPGAPGEVAIATSVADRLRWLGLDVMTLESHPGRPSVIGTLRGAGGGRSLMLNAHLDTVGVDGMPDPLTPIVCDGKMHGRGTYDMKGSLAACLAAAKALVDANVALRGDLVLAAVADEEYASLGTTEVARRVPVQAAIVTEPTELDLCIAHKGFVWLEVETRGRAAHGSRFFEGIDANMRMGRFLARLDHFEQELRVRPPHPLVGPPSLHAPLLRGGTELSTYAARCILGIERQPRTTEARRPASSANRSGWTRQSSPMRVWKRSSSARSEAGPTPPRSGWTSAASRTSPPSWPKPRRTTAPETPSFFHPPIRTRHPETLGKKESPTKEVRPSAIPTDPKKHLEFPFQRRV